MATTQSNIWAKLAKAQAEMPQPVFDSANSHFGNRYASLKAINDAVTPSLLKYGLFPTQEFAADLDRMVLSVLTTVVDTETTESVTLAIYPIPLAGLSQQQIGSAITYGRRYSLSSAFCRVADEDDDGNLASEPSAVVVDDVRENAKNRLWKAIDDWCEQQKADKKAVAEDALKAKPLKDWTAEELDALAAHFEGEVV